MLKVNNLTFSYPSGTSLFRELSCDFPELGIVHLLGPNGSGKTTFLNLLAHLIYPQTGDISYQGAKIRETQVSLMPSNCDSSFHQLTGRETLNLFAGLNLQESWEALPYHELFKFLPTYTNALNTKFAFCSTGMKQFLNFCRTLSKGSKILLLDEPFQGLDQETRAALTQFLYELKKDHLIVLTSHESLSLESDQEFFVKEGRIQGA